MPLDQSIIEALADRAKDSSFDEWSACMTAAYDHNGGDLADAITIADEIIKAGPLCESRR